MKPNLIGSLFILWCLTISSRMLRAEQPLPRWLAVSDQSLERWHLSHSVTVKQPVVSGRLKLIADFARASVFLNDREVLTLEPYCQLQTIDVTHWLELGLNRLRVDVERVAGPTAVACELEIKFPSGRSELVQSDQTWLAASGSRSIELQVLESVRAEMWGSGRRDASLSPVENYDQWKQALSGDAQIDQPKFWTADGFEVSQVRTAQPDEGSWISLTFDEQGRALVSREDSGLLRMTLAADRQTVERVEPINVDLKECRGLAFHDGWLYANANNSKGLYRLKIDAGGRAEGLARLREFPGGVGHGRNDIIIDNDWLITIHGDSVDLPQENVTDLTSPLRHWSGDASQHEGHVLRMHLPTGKWELLCGGLRNPYGIAAHPSGELFTFDADNEFDMGTPWYRPTRVIGLYPGGDIGYRTAGNKLPPRFHDQPENVPPVLTIGRSSPTAVFYDAQLNFPKAYRDALFLLDWTYGRVLAVHLAENGAGWRAQAEQFLQGRPLNVTDVARGPDGAMYLITGGRKTQSSLYRIAAHAVPERARSVAVEPFAPHAAAVSAFSKEQRVKRQHLERISRERDADGLADILATLDDADPVLRHAARIALERLPIELWRDVALKDGIVPRGLYAHLAFAQAASPADVPGLIERWLGVDPSQLELSEQFGWVRLCELLLRSSGDAVQRRSQEVCRRLLAAWPRASALEVAPEGTTVQLRQRIAQLLGALRSAEAIEPIARDLLASSRQEDRLAGLLALRYQRDGWTIKQRKLQFEALGDPTAMIGGQGMPTFHSGIKGDSLASLSEKEKELLQDVLEPRPLDDQAEQFPPRAVVQRWQMSDLANLAESDNTGDRQRGAKVFREAMCGRCHRVGSSGGVIGPDLTFVGRRFNRRDLLDSIVQPSRSVAENYRLDLVVTHSGAVHTGRILVEGDYRSEKLKIQTDPLQVASVVEIDKREIEDHRQLERSPMPEGLLDTFHQDEIRDLLAYLERPE